MHASLLLLLACYCTADCYQAKVVPFDGVQNDIFGDAADVGRNVAIVSSLWDDDVGVTSGSAYVFRRTDAGWTHEEKLVASDGEEGAWFGFSVAIEDEVAVVGAERDNPIETSEGSAYVFRFDAGSGRWVEEQKLVASDAQPIDNFGYAVDVSNGFIVVGAWRDDDIALTAGAAYAFRYDEASKVWVEEQKIVTPDAGLSSVFGSSVSLHCDNSGVCDVLIGAFLDGFVADNAGAAFHFHRNPSTGVWTQVQRLTASNAMEDQQLGISVALVEKASGERFAIAGASEQLSDQIGAIYVYRQRSSSSEWDEMQILVPDDAQLEDAVGWSVSAACLPSGACRILVGSLLNDELGTDAGAVYVYDLVGDVWVQQDKITAFDGAAFDWFAYAVSLTPDTDDMMTALVSARQDDDACPENPACNSGSAYFFRIGLVDYDADCDVDVADFVHFDRCVGRSLDKLDEQLCNQREFAISDTDGDGDVDLHDFAAMQRQFSPDEE